MTNTRVSLSQSRRVSWGIKLDHTLLKTATLLLGLCASTFGTRHVLAQQNPDVGGAAMYSNKTIIQNAGNSPVHKTLVAAVRAAGLVDTLNGPGPFTVFAPTDDAFEKMPASIIDNLVKPENHDTLEKILQYHIVPGKFTTSLLVKSIKRNGGSFRMRTLEGEDLIASSEEGKVVLTDEAGGRATIITADVLQSNGVIQVIDSVLSPIRSISYGSSLHPSPPQTTGLGHPKVAVADYQVVKIFFATDRAPGRRSAEVQAFLNERSPSDSLTFGQAEVSIPRDHRMGNVERPSLLRLEFREDPEKHVVLLKAQSLSEEAFKDAITAKVSGDPKKSALVFVHGYNVEFEAAALRLGQLTYDLGFSGAPILYSWPSQGTLLGYLADEASAEWSTPHFTHFLQSLRLNLGVQTIYIVGHSMGNRLISAALANFPATAQPRNPAFQEVIMAAPDVDAGVFAHLSAAVRASASRVTIYESSRDLALSASHKFHDYARLGDTNPAVHVIEQYDCVEASSVATDFLGHSYFGDSTTILGDIFDLISTGNPPSLRLRLEPRQLGGEPYWSFKR